MSNSKEELSTERSNRLKDGIERADWSNRNPNGDCMHFQPTLSPSRTSGLTWLIFNIQVYVQVDDDKPRDAWDQSSIRSGTSNYSASIRGNGTRVNVPKPMAVSGEVSSLRGFNYGEGEDAAKHDVVPGKSDLSPPSSARPVMLSTRTWTGFPHIDLSRYGVEDHRYQLIEPIKKGPINLVGSLTYLMSGDWLQTTKMKDSKSQSYNRKNPDDSFRLSIAEMQRMRLRKLQGKLIKHAAQLQFEGTEPYEWEADLQQYSTSLPIEYLFY